MDEILTFKPKALVKIHLLAIIGLLLLTFRPILVVSRKNDMQQVPKPPKLWQLG